MSSNFSFNIFKCFISGGLFCGLGLSLVQMEGKYLYLCNNQIERILCQDYRSLTRERPYIFCVQPMAIGGAYTDIDL